MVTEILVVMDKTINNEGSFRRGFIFALELSFV